MARKRIRMVVVAAAVMLLAVFGLSRCNFYGIPNGSYGSDVQKLKKNAPKLVF